MGCQFAHVNHPNWKDYDILPEDLAEHAYDAESGTLSVALRPQPGARYTIEFIGTLSDFDRAARTKTARRRQPNPAHSPLRANPEVGRVLQTFRGTSATYKLTGKELYVRAVVHSNLPMANPPGSDNEVKRQIAWCQPVGWEKWVK